MPKYLDITDYDRIVHEKLWVYDTSELEEMLEEFPVVETLGWTNVKERLPVEDGQYIVLYESYGGRFYFQEVLNFKNDMSKTMFFGDGETSGKRPGFYRYDSEYGDVEIDDVLYWAPLLPLPKELTEKNANPLYVDSNQA